MPRKKKPTRTYRARDLAKAGGVSQRTLTRWFAHGVLGPPPRRGPGVSYGADQILRARAAAQIRLHTADLDAIRRRLDRATRAELEDWAENGFSPRKAAVPAPAAGSFPATRFEHVEVAPGLTLLVRAGCEPAVRRLAEEIYARYGPARR
jgi:DNA-binding transcriptional MerR regulator